MFTNLFKRYTEAGEVLVKEESRISRWVGLTKFSFDHGYLDPLWLPYWLAYYPQERRVSMSAPIGALWMYSLWTRMRA